MPGNTQPGCCNSLPVLGKVLILVAGLVLLFGGIVGTIICGCHLTAGEAPGEMSNISRNAGWKYAFADADNINADKFLTENNWDVDDGALNRAKTAIQRAHGCIFGFMVSLLSIIAGIGLLVKGCTILRQPPPRLTESIELSDLDSPVLDGADPGNDDPDGTQVSALRSRLDSQELDQIPRSGPGWTPQTHEPSDERGSMFGRLPPSNVRGSPYNDLDSPDLDWTPPIPELENPDWTLSVPVCVPEHEGRRSKFKLHRLPYSEPNFTNGGRPESVIPIPPPPPQIALNEAGKLEEALKASGTGWTPHKSSAPYTGDLRRRLGTIPEFDSSLSGWFIGSAVSLLLAVPIVWCIRRRLRKIRAERRDSFGFLPDSQRTSLTLPERMV